MNGVWGYIFRKRNLEKDLVKLPIFEKLSKTELDLILKYCYERKYPDKETTVEAVIDELLSGGICYEPSPGKIKKI